MKGGVLNPASMKQALVEGAQRIPGINLYEQGAGKMNLLSSMVGGCLAATPPCCCCRLTMHGTLTGHWPATCPRLDSPAGRMLRRPIAACLQLPAADIASGVSCSHQVSSDGHGPAHPPAVTAPVACPQRAACKRIGPQLACGRRSGPGTVMRASGSPVRAQEVLQSYVPRASVVPAHLDLTDCPYMWPHCTQPLYAGAMPLMFNATVLNGLGLTGAAPALHARACSRAGLGTLLQAWLGLGLLSAWPATCALS